MAAVSSESVLFVSLGKNKNRGLSNASSQASALSSKSGSLLINEIKERVRKELRIVRKIDTFKELCAQLELAEGEEK